MSANNDIQSTSIPEHRMADRSAAELKTIVRVNEGEDVSWEEVIEVSTVSRNGAGFMLTRPCTVGRLITLIMPLEPRLRAYDVKEELYHVMSIVQYCNSSTIDGETVYHVGVGFVGKKPPASFKADPMQDYRINGMKKDGLWQVIEAESQFKSRKTPRYWFSLPVALTLLQQADRTLLKEFAFTKNIGVGGVSVSCTLEAEVGDKVKFACKELDFYSMAVVRNRKMLTRELPTLHLEFIDYEFPIDELIAAHMAALVVV